MPSVTVARAGELFNLVNSKVCCPANPSVPCIPFVYPDDGCWGRAHEMCRLMIAAGAAPRKIWIQGSLRLSSRNKPDCVVRWGWHVAPTLEVSNGGPAQTYVIDPALFEEPVSQATWVSVQGDPNPTLTPTGPEIFHLFYAPHRLDPSYSLTNGVLSDYRNELRLRSVSSSGPPPYLNCMSRSAGVQWLGTIEANAQRRWFTFGWPANRHVIWTVMPLTPCPGRPQLSWKVAVERADANNCTYWITVKNLTAETVRFEGRFNYLN
jgi:Glutaminase